MENMSSQSNTTPAGGGSSSSSSASSRSDEKQLFRHRARLFTMNTAGQWSELGTGDAKILLHGATNRTRLVMRKDKTMTIILNQLIQPEAILVNAKSQENGGGAESNNSSNTNGRAFVFEAEDFATGVTKKETFAIRFKVEEVASEFQRVYTEAQERNRVVFALEAATVRQQQNNNNKPVNNAPVTAGASTTASTDPASSVSKTMPSSSYSTVRSSSANSSNSSSSVNSSLLSASSSTTSSIQPTIHEDPNENNEDDDDDAKTATSTLTEDETPVPPNTIIVSSSSSNNNPSKTLSVGESLPSSLSSSSTSSSSTSSGGTSFWLKAGIALGVTAAALYWADKQGHIQLKPFFNEAKQTVEKSLQTLRATK